MEMTTRAKARPKRPYALKARREQVAATRARIVDATVALHEEVGPRRTTIKAIAERAGVERLTVYRHFPNERAIVEACSACWAERHPPPDPQSWREETSPTTRTRCALTALYAYFAANHRMLQQVHHDLREMPALADVTAPFLHYLEAVAEDLAQAWAKAGHSSGGLRAVLQQIVRFETWSLLEAAGWDDTSKVSRLLQWVLALAGKP